MLCLCKLKAELITQTYCEFPNLNTFSFSFYIQSFSLTECIVIVGVRKYRSCLSVSMCVSVYLCVCVCLWTAVLRNYLADFNEPFQNVSTLGLVVRICVSAN